MSITKSSGRLLAGLALAAGALLVQGPADAATFNFVANLTGDQEPVLPAGLGPSTATGFATGTLTGDFGQNNWVFTYSGTFSNLSSLITVRHIHNAPFGVNGPVVHDLDFATVATSGVFSGEWRFDDSSRPLTETLANELIAGRGYFNIHSQTYPGGEIRGQIELVPEPSGLAGTFVLALGGLIARKRNRA
jgi:hypothetical protein